MSSSTSKPRFTRPPEDLGTQYILLLVIFRCTVNSLFPRIRESEKATGKNSLDGTPSNQERGISLNKECAGGHGHSTCSSLCWEWAWLPVFKLLLGAQPKITQGNPKPPIPNLHPWARSIFFNIFKACS